MGCTMPLRFEQTCEACPEQYDVFEGDKLVGYIRLRWSQLTVQCPDVGGELVYESQIGDSGWDGCFEDEAQRMLHLKVAEGAIEDWIRRQDA